MDDVLIVGAGPAGAVAGVVLARAGARVRIVDRSSFPRHKLCGDTINPGTLALLGRLNLASGLDARGLRMSAMLVTGLGGVAIEGRYPSHLYGVSISRRELDWLLFQQAVAAGAVVETGVTVREALVGEHRGVRTVTGVVAGSNGSSRRFEARVVIAADGRRSTLAFGLGQARHPATPRRWAIGAYFESGGGSRPVGEMHIRPGRYIGVAPLPNGVTNVCLVKPASGNSSDFRHPAVLLKREIDAEPMLRDRFSGRQPIRPPTMLGPLAVDATGEETDGLIFAGDAAGFIDPMTGDGLRFAIRGGELAAQAALGALEHGWSGLHQRLSADRRSEFGAKWRFNRWLRATVASPLALKGATVGARLAPGVIRALIAHAGDCDVAAQT